MTGLNVLLPFSLPDTKSLRRAAANILRDIQRDNEQTDQETADCLGVSVGTIRNVRNEQTDISSLLLARIGARFGEEAVRPYTALWSHDRPSDEVIPALADAMAAISRAHGPKGEFDALPAVKAAISALAAFADKTETKRLRLVS